MLLYAGPLQMLYDRGFLRYISYRDSEIFRMIYFAVRDENWGTCDHRIINEHRDISWETFRVEYDCFHSREQKDLMKWHCVIEGRPNGSISFTINGEALEDHLKNRSGFCLLHPAPAVAGTSANLTHADGSKSESTFPTLISGENPFRNLHKIKWSCDSREYELTMEGDVFETEDQRNWTDNSFKTFCTPADLPIPVKIKKGQKIWQKVQFKPLEHLPPIPTQTTLVVQLEKTDGITKLPAVGVCASDDVKALNEQCVSLLKELKFDHYRINVTPSHTDWVSKFSSDYEQSFRLELPLEVALFISDDVETEIDAFIQLCQQNRVRIKNLMLFNKNKPVTDEKILAHTNRFRTAFHNVKIGVGTDDYFKEINRKQVLIEGVDFITYSLHPQVHAFDDLTMIENIEGQAHTVVTALEKYKGIDVHVSPITLKKRNKEKEHLPDHRQSTELNALWTFGTLRSVAEGKASNITLFQTAGAAGIISEEGNPYPVFDVLAKILPYRDQEMIVLKSSHPLWVEAMLFRKGDHSMLWLANHTDDLQTVTFGRMEIQLQPRTITQTALHGS